MSGFSDWRRDWTNRQAAGVGLVVTALSLTAGLLSRSVGFGLAVLLAAAGIALLIQHWRFQHHAAEPVFTSDGLDWKRLGGGVLRITPNESGAELPQPLTLRVQCSQNPKDGWATFYSDTRDGGSNRGNDPVRAKISGNSAYFVLKDPKLRPPAMLSVALIGISPDDVEDVQRQVPR